MIVVYVLFIIVGAAYAVGLAGWIVSLIKAKRKHEWCNLFNKYLWTIIISGVAIWILNVIVQVNRMLS